MRNSLGLCKHVLTVVAESLASRRKLDSSSATKARRPRLVWDPIRPLTGPADWIERVRLVRTTGADGSLDGLVRHFDEGGALEAIPATAAGRHALVEELWDASRRHAVAGDPALLALLREERERWGAVLRLRPSALAGSTLRATSRPSLVSVAR